MRTSKSIWHIFFILCIFSISFAQTPDTLWTKRYGGKCGYAVRQTFDNGYFVAGQKISSERDHIWLLRTDEDGDTLWTRIYGDTTTSSTAYDMQITPDGGCIIVGEKAETWPNDLFLLRVDRFGDTLWTKTYGNYGHAVGYSIEKTSDGCFIIAGSVDSEDYLWLLKTDENGDTVWTQRYAEGGGVGYSVRQTADGGYIVAGRAGSRLYIVKTNSAGNPVWTRTFLDSLNSAELISIVETFDNGYIVAATRHFYVPWEAVLMKVDVYGDSIWCQTYSSPYFEGCGLHCIEKTADSNYIATGYHTSADVMEFWILKIDDNGDTLWTIILNGTSFSLTSGFAVQQTQDGGYIAVGADDDVWIIKTESDVGIYEDKSIVRKNVSGVTIFSGPLRLPQGKNCRFFDITGRVVAPDMIQPGIYFVEVDGVITRKVVKVR